MPLGVRGCLVTCPGGWEGRCRSEILNVLNEYAEETNKGNEDPTDVGSKGRTVEELLQEEVGRLKNPTQARFWWHDIGIHGAIFVSFTDSAPASVTDFVHRIVKDIKLTGQSKTRYTMRILPIEITCFAALADIEKAFRSHVDKFLPGGEGTKPLKYAIDYEHRASNKMDRMAIIEALAKAVPAPHTVDLSNPDVTITVQIMKNACCLGWVREYKELGKYNLQRLAESANEESLRKDEKSQEDDKQKTEEETQPEQDEQSK